MIIFDIDGVIRDVGGSYRRAIADTVEYFTEGAYRPTMEDIDQLKSEGIWNNDWQASQELIRRFFQTQQRHRPELDYSSIVAFFQSRYRGSDPQNFDGYITSEPLLLEKGYLQQLSDRFFGWGFFSGATRGSAEYVLKQRLGLKEPVLVAMEDAPGKPDPTGLLATVGQIEAANNLSQPIPVIYVGDTVADLYTVTKARAVAPERLWLGVGILPPHVQSSRQRQQEYAAKLREAGAVWVASNVQQLTPRKIEELIALFAQNGVI